MSPLSAPEARFRAWLTAHAPPHAPEGLRHRALRAIDEVDQLQPWVARLPILRFSMPAVAAVTVLLVAIGLAAVAGGLLNVVVPPSATETVRPSATPPATASPTAEPSTASPTAAASLEPVAGLIAGPATCVDEAYGFQVAVPPGWYTNEATESGDACRYFSPAAFDPTFGAQQPALAITFSMGGAPGADLIGDPSPSQANPLGPTILERTEQTLDGLPVLRVLFDAPQFGRALMYVISLDGAPLEPNADGSFLYAATSGRSQELDRDAAALDGIMAGFARIDTTPVTPTEAARIALPYATGQVPLPEQVAVTSDAIWTLGSAGTHLLKIDLGTNSAVSDVAVDHGRIEVDDTGGLWLLAPWGVTPEPTTMTLSRIDGSNGTVHPFREVPAASDIAVGQNAVWLLGDTIRVLDPHTGELVRELPANYGGLNREGRPAAPVSHIDLACASLWTWRPDPQVPSRWYLSLVDGYTGDPLSTYKLPSDTMPQLVDIGAYCWTNFRSDLMGLTPSVDPGASAPESSPAPPGAWQFAGQSVWAVTEGGLAQRIDPVTGDRVGSAYQLPVADLHVVANGDPNWRLLSAGGNLWILNDTELIRFDIPSK